MSAERKESPMPVSAAEKAWRDAAKARKADLAPDGSVEAFSAKSGLFVIPGPAGFDTIPLTVRDLYFESLYQTLKNRGGQANVGDVGRHVAEIASGKAPLSNSVREKAPREEAWYAAVETLLIQAKKPEAIAATASGAGKAAKTAFAELVEAHCANDALRTKLYDKAIHIAQERAARRVVTPSARKPKAVSNVAVDTGLTL